MVYIIPIFQIIIACSIIIVWVFRFDNIVKEFKEYGLSDLIRNMVGACKISLSTLLVIGIWYHKFAIISGFIMALLMFGAQLSHFKVRHSFSKYIPSFILLILSLTVSFYYLGLLN